VSTSQDPDRQLPTAWGGSHTVPQEPQSVTAARRVSQPLLATPSQSPWPASHDSTVHRSPSQPAVANGSSHRSPQPPQCSTSPVVSTQLPEQRSGVGSTQPLTHPRPPETVPQTGASPSQRTSQAPHVPGDPRSASQPSEESPLQSARSAGQPSGPA